MAEHITFEVDQSLAGSRLDVAVAGRVPDVSRTWAQWLIDEGLVWVSGRPGRAAQRLQAGQTVEIELVRPPPLSAQPEEIPLEVVYEDDDLAVIDKPAGLVVHPATGHESGTLANALAARYPRITGGGQGERPGIVHRLDKDTSGLMVVALSPAALASLQRQIKERTAGREYIALVAGHLVRKEGIIDAPIGRDPHNRLRMAAHGIAARPARTRFQVRDELPHWTLLDLALDTGRTHQIRVHLAALGHPVAGDTLYGGPALNDLTRQFLHSRRLRLRSPRTGEEMSFESPLPADLQRALDAARAE